MSKQIMRPQAWDQPTAKRMAKKASRLRSNEFKLRKKALGIEGRGQLIELLKTGIQSPVWAGTSAFLFVHGIESSLKVFATEQAKHKDQVKIGSYWYGPSELAAYCASHPGDPNCPSANGSPPKKQPDLFSEFLNILAGAAGNVLGSISGFGPVTGQVTQGLIAQVQVAALGSGTLLDILKNLDFSSLKIVILMYIASGGNLAGLLQSSGGILTDVLKAAGISAAVAAP